jgi:hypothetical protein
MTYFFSTLLSVFLFAGNPTAPTTKKIPPLNVKVIEYVDSKMGKKVDRGECWDLAAFALDFAGAYRPGLYVFGKELDPSKDKIYPGDVVQMFKVKFTWGGRTPQHTLVVYEVLGDGKYKMAEQNVGGVRKVMISNYDMASIAKGEVHFYRPAARK